MHTLAYSFATFFAFIADSFLYCMVVRLLMQIAGVRWENNIVQFIVKVTEPVVKLSRPLVARTGNDNLAIFVPILFIEVLMQILLIWAKITVIPGIFGSFVISLGAIANKVIDIYFYGAILYVLMTWLPALANAPLSGFINSIVEPIMRPFQSRIPLVGGIDLSPIVVLLLLKLVSMLLIKPLIIYGYVLAY